MSNKKGKLSLFPPGSVHLADKSDGSGNKSNNVNYKLVEHVEKGTKKIFELVQFNFERIDRLENELKHCRKEIERRKNTTS